MEDPTYQKNPIFNNKGKVVNLFAHAIDLSNSSQFKVYMNFHQLDSKLFGKPLKSTSYTLNSEYTPIPLTEKQENCLFLLVRGKTVKEIAKILQLSPRTVECHIEAIKIKLDCQYKSEIVGKAIEKGFLHYIPKILQHNLSSI